MLRVPFYKPSIGAAEIAEVMDSLTNGWLTTGPKSKEFEREFARYLQRQHAVALNSCTAALHLALEAIGLQPNDSVLVPTLTFAATAEVARYFDARPILVDCKALDFNLDVADAEEKIQSSLAHGGRPAAIIPVHYGGQIGDVGGVRKLAEKYHLKVIEDAAHCCPAFYRDDPSGAWKTVGSDADISCFSFYANKPITTGEGGMACTDREDYAERMRIMSLHGISRDAWNRFSAAGSWYYEILAPGFKYNLSDIAASLGLHQLRRADELHRKRTRLAELYREKLEEVDELILPTTQPDRIHSWHLHVVRLRLNKVSISRAEVIEELKRAGIGASVHYLPLHMHPYYRERFGYTPEDLPCAARLYPELITLPNYPDMTEEQVGYVCDQLKQIIVRQGKRRAAEKLSIMGNTTATARDNDGSDAAVTAKRLYDVGLAALGLLLLSPLFFLLAVLIKLADGGPVFYRQRRVGLHGEPFEIWKFRSMVVDADKLGPALTQERDSRITWMGGLMRKTKLDELPQLWNVLRGEMSLVGPRPEVPRYVETYSLGQREILKWKPGITDPATLAFRKEEWLLRQAEDLEQFYTQHCLPRKIRLNQDYASRANLWSDTGIIFRTLCPDGLGLAFIYSLIFAASLWLSYQLRFEFGVPAGVSGPWWQFLAWLIPLKLGLLCWRRHFRGLPLYFSFPEMNQIGAALSLAAAIELGLGFDSSGALAPPRSIVLIDFILGCVLLSSFRIILRLDRENYFTKSVAGAPLCRVGIIGVGEEGASLARALFTRRNLGVQVVGFFDDAPDKWHKCLHNVPVIGMPEILLEEEWRGKLDGILIALPEAAPARVEEIAALLAKAGLWQRRIPGLDQLLEARRTLPSPSAAQGIYSACQIKII